MLVPRHLLVLLLSTTHSQALWFMNNGRLNMTIDPGDFEIDLAANIGCVYPPVEDQDSSDNMWQSFDILLAADNIATSDPDLTGYPGLICALLTNETIQMGSWPYILTLPDKIGQPSSSSSSNPSPQVKYYLALKRHRNQGPDLQDPYRWTPPIPINQQKLDGDTALPIAYNARNVPCASIECVRSCQNNHAYPLANDCVHTTCRLDSYSQQSHSASLTRSPDADPPPYSDYTCSSYFDSPPCSLTGGTDCPTPTASAELTSSSVSAGATPAAPGSATSTPVVTALVYHPTARRRSGGVRLGGSWTSRGGGVVVVLASAVVGGVLLLV
ncbi:hypothetical protein EJ05DRAFT_513347 [Pseudovirgaria hyperparasitica]|uniref:Uncharacterized protein n=1 Tax=Pseudovirgaria hyperparasitica TaxID=470096 RepID=A0A6A6W0B9_9PEZI|nr:uncharacterized protein EJ05DRAFT_513347 [Pseudovirgaria hyperparasitica]KAF2755027.1 hypothetical protein EJ05DRAFT_513347 [Pseudovirgaria hyperparasitica]